MQLLSYFMETSPSIAKRPLHWIDLLDAIAAEARQPLRGIVILMPPTAREHFFVTGSERLGQGQVVWVMGRH
jgi:hypothetical protein